ncbi:MAG: DMP19 family protein [Micromonosporaceae bacterium]
MTTLLQPQPESADGAFWFVFEHLAEADLQDPSAMSKMTPEQRQVFALGMLRQEVNSGGFDAYFRYNGGNTALDAKDAAPLIGPSWELVITEACNRVGHSYPTDQAVREASVDELTERDPEAFERLDSAFYDLEADRPADDKRTRSSGPTAAHSSHDPRSTAR